MKEVKCATKAFIMDNGKLLVIKQGKHGKEWWDMPGGAMEFGLTPEENLKKEVKEELGIEIKIKKLIGVSQFVDRRGDQIICLDYLCEPKSKDLDLTKNPDKRENIIKFFWLTPEEFHAKLPDSPEQKGLKNFVKDCFLG